MEDCEQALFTHQQDDAPKIIRVPMATYPPTAIVYSVSRTQQPDRVGPDTIPSAIIARVLAKPDSRAGGKRAGARVIICGRCMAEESLVDRGIQTDVIGSSRKDCSSPVNGETDVLLSEGSKSMTFEPRVHRSQYSSSESSGGGGAATPLM